MDSNNTPRVPLQNPQQQHACIVGAGAAGLRCAHILLEHGFKVTVLEARDRVGGRIHQVRMPHGHLVDMGPNWIHNSGDRRPFIDIAEKTDTALHSYELKGMVFDENGKFIEDGIAMSEKVWDLISKAIAYSKANTATIDPHESLYDFLVKEMDQSDVDEQTKHNMLQAAKVWSTYVGMAVTQQSLKFLWLEACVEGFEGDNVFCAGTYKNMLAHIAKPVLEEADVRLSEPVRSITSSGAGVIVESSKSTIHCSTVVVTAPLGWLKRNQTCFKPHLPDRVSQAIDHIGYGSLEKIYITFNDAWWRDKSVNSDQQSYTGFTQWPAPAWDKQNPNRWNVDVIELSTLPAPNAHNTLLFYIYGEQSETLTNDLLLLSDEERHKYLVKFFESYYSMLPNYDAESSACKAVASLATDWLHDEYAGNGGYTCFPIGMQNADEDIKALRRGVPESHLYFAGEHTAPFDALGAVAGAYMSGESIGLEIVERYGKSRPLESTELLN